MQEVFKYLNGGCDGVKQRFRNLVSDRLERVSMFDLPYLEKRAGFGQDGFHKLINGDLSVVTSKAIQNLSDPLDYSVDDVLGPLVNFDDDARKYWTEKMRKEKFIAVSSANPALEQGKLEIFMIMEALREL